MAAAKIEVCVRAYACTHAYSIGEGECRGLFHVCVCVCVFMCYLCVLTHVYA